jgi:hypothetical protein
MVLHRADAASLVPPEAYMKLVNRKTKKAIEKSVRKAMKKHGPALLAGLASGLAATIASLAKTEAPQGHGKSNLADIVEQAKDSLTGEKKSHRQGREKKRARRMADGERTRLSVS